MLKMEDMREEAMRIMMEMDEETLLEWIRWVREAALKDENARIVL